MHETTNCLVKEGDYVIVKKKNYKKVHKVSESNILTLGKEQIETKCMIGKAFWTTFEIIPSKNHKNIQTLQPIIKAESLDKLKNDLPSGLDNRSINDDGTSQQLSKEEILDLRKAGKTSKEIVTSLIENSSSFHAKTEYSQEKYIRKKEKKYFQYLTICKPTIELLQDIYFHQDYMKISCLRVDTLAQILSYCDIKSDGVYLLYDSGSSGLSAASMLNRIGANTEGSLVHIYPGNEAQTTIIQAMNFPKEQFNRLFNISITSFIKSGCDEDSNEEVKPNPQGCTSDNKPQLTTETTPINTAIIDTVMTETTTETTSETTAKQNSLKRRNPEETHVSYKKSKISHAMDLLNTEKAEGLVVIAKEHPLNIIETLIPFLKKSRPFVIYHSNREPLQDTYIALKQKFTVVNLKLFSTFLRTYQVLTDRTHPDILTNHSSGYILTGYLVE